MRLANRDKLCPMSSSSKGHWEFRSPEDVQRFWKKHQNIPRRIDGRKHHDEERFNLALYLLALSDHGELTYPLCIEQGREHESPDFMMTWPSGEITGLEVTRATERWLQREIKEGEKNSATWKSKVFPMEMEARSIPLSFAGWARDQAEIQWCSMFRTAMEKKVRKLRDFRPASQHDLLIYDEGPLPGPDRAKAISAMHPFVRRLQDDSPGLGKISLLVSLDVLYDVGGEAQCFRYIEPPDPDAERRMKTFSERSAYAGQLSADRSVRELVLKGIPIYSWEGKGGVVKQTSDGRRFEVTFREDGEEVILRELPRR
jgi:hypothetical protein